MMTTQLVMVQTEAYINTSKCGSASFAKLAPL